MSAGDLKSIIAPPSPARLPDDHWIDPSGRRFRVVDRQLIDRPVEETSEQRSARIKAGKPARMIGFVVGRIVS